MINNYLLYVAIAFTVTAIPGPAVILTIKNSIKHGPQAAMANIMGNFVAMILLATLSALGLGAIILASPELFYILKLLGCAYLVSLGIKAWRAPYSEAAYHTDSSNERPLVALFKQGFTVGISNPKAIAFFTALFPQFIDLTRDSLPQYTTLILTIEGSSFIVLSSYALLGSAIAPLLSRRRPMRLFNKVTGISLISFGLGLLYAD